VERLIRDNEYNDLQPWRYHLLPEVFGSNKGFNCNTEGELEV
jgi:indolepyruvate decarboxylase